MINSITLCGSNRFEEYFKMWSKSLALKTDLCVYNLSLYHSDLDAKMPLTRFDKIILEATHFKKIMFTESILVLDYPLGMKPPLTDIQNNLGKHFNSEGYIGESTAREILFARQFEKKIFFASYYKYDPENFAQEKDKTGENYLFKNDWDKADKTQ